MLESDNQTYISLINSSDIAVRLSTESEYHQTVLDEDRRRKHLLADASKEIQSLRQQLQKQGQVSKFADEMITALQAGIEEKDKQLERLRSDQKDLMSQLQQQRSEIIALRNQKFERFDEDECWIYQGDGNDNLESLVCPVVIAAPDLAAKDKQLAEAQAENEKLHGALCDIGQVIGLPMPEYRLKMLPAVRERQAIIDKLPKTADGVVGLTVDTFWVADRYRGIARERSVWDEFSVSRMYSTREAAQAALDALDKGEG